jgi:hypothetical protein
LLWKIAPPVQAASMITATYTDAFSPIHLFCLSLLGLLTHDGETDKTTSAASELLHV